jgi:acetolactate synthase-1/2/3 large subunit
MIKYGQQLSDAESIGWKLNEVNFAALAEAQGAKGIIINSPEELHKLNLDDIFNAKTPTLLDVRIDPDEVPPMMSRVKSLAEKEEQPNGYSAQ